MLLGSEHLKSTSVLQYDSKNIVSFTFISVNHETVKVLNKKRKIFSANTTNPFISINLTRKQPERISSTRSGPFGKGLEMNHLNKEGAHSNKRSTKPDLGRKRGFFHAQIIGNIKSKTF